MTLFLPLPLWAARWPSQAQTALLPSPFWSRWRSKRKGGGVRTDAVQQRLKDPLAVTFWPSSEERKNLPLLVGALSLSR